MNVLNDEWRYPDGCKIYGPSSPHGVAGQLFPDHEHDLITATQCWHCGDMIELNPPAKTINEADERTHELCNCGKAPNAGDEEL